MRLKSTQMVPPLGWTVNVEGVKLEGATEKQAVALARRHLQAKGVTVSDEEARDYVHDQICQRWPEGCRQISGPRPSIGSLNWTTMARNFVGSVTRFVKGGFRVVEPEHAAGRASICLSCPKNQSSVAVRSGCPTCKRTVMNDLADAIASGLKSLAAQKKSTPYDSRLRACAVCGCDLKLLVWFPISAIGKSEAELKEMGQAVPFCWQVQEGLA